jgi:hypothetical protein
MPVTAHDRRVLPAVVAVGFGALVWWTWASWPDPVVDAGREVVAATRLAGGAVLYRDVAWFNGPFSAYWNAVWMATLGPSFRTLFLVNLALVAAFTALVYRMLRFDTGVFAAGLGAMMFLTCFAFGQQLDIGNYNWIAPYSHELTHGVMLGGAGLASWVVCVRRNSIRWARVWGGATGLVCLTKPETAVAGLCGFAVAAAFLVRRAPDRRRLVWTACAWLTVPAVAAAALFALALTPRAAVAASLGAWQGLTRDDVTGLSFYRAVSGLDHPNENLGRLLESFSGWLLVLGTVAAASWTLRARVPAAAYVARTAAVAAAVWSVGLMAQPALGPDDAARALPLVLAVAAVATWVLAWRETRDSALETGAGAGTRRPWMERVPFVVWALVLLAKTALATRLSHYGFGLALPAVLVVVAGIAGWWPEWCARSGRAAWIARGAALGLTLAVATTQLVVTASHLHRKTTVVGGGADAVRADARGAFVQKALALLEGRRQPGETLVVLPEGATLNHWSGLANPTPYLNFMPPELLLFGEDRMRAALESAAPTWLVLVHKDTSEYGVPLFGRDYGRSFAPWIAAHYELIDTYGDAPLQPGSRFGVAVLRRMSARP